MAPVVSADSLRSRTFYSKEYTAQFPGKDGMSGHGVIIPVVAYSWADHCYQYDSATSRTLAWWPRSSATVPDDVNSPSRSRSVG